LIIVVKFKNPGFSRDFLFSGMKNVYLITLVILTGCSSYLYSGENGKVMLTRKFKTTHNNACIAAIITDSKGYVLEGAVLKSSDTKTGAVSDNNGKIKLHFNPAIEKKWIISYPNYSPIEIPVKMKPRDSICIRIMMVLEKNVIID